MSPLNGRMYGLPALKDYDDVLQRHGKQAYVRAIAEDFAPRISRSGDLRLFRHLRRAYAGASHVDLDRLFVREIAKLLPPELQQELMKELPKRHRRDLELWNTLPWFARFILRIRS
jgi:hypothetical protein